MTPPTARIRARARWYERALAAVTGTLYLGLAAAVYYSADGSLNFPDLWPVTFVVGGLAAWATIWRHSGLSWSLTTAWLTTTTWGRGWDIALNLDDFSARAWIALTFHAGLGALVFVSWVAIGGTVDALDNERA